MTVRRRSAVCWLAALGMTAAMFALIFLVLDPQYAVNDDSGILRPFMGFETGEPAHFHIYLHGLLAWPLHWLVLALPGVAWLSWMQLAFLFLASAVCQKSIMQRFAEINNGIPRLVIVTLLLLVLSPGFTTIVLALVITEWISMSRIARAEMLKLKEQEFVLASRTLGAGSMHIIFSEVLPNIIGQIITQLMFTIPTAIFTEAFLSFVGLGIPVPQCSLGSLINDAFNSFTTHPYQIVPPIVVLAVLMLSFNMLADGLREAFDPKLKEM